MSTPEEVSNTPEEQFFHEVFGAMLECYQETEPLDSLDLSALDEVDTVKRFLFDDDIRGIMQAGMRLRVRVRELSELLPEELRAGSWQFTSIIDRVIALDDISDGEDTEESPIVCPEGTGFYEFTPALLIAARATGRTMTGVFNDTTVVATAESSLRTMQRDYWRVHFAKHGLQA